MSPSTLPQPPRRRLPVSPSPQARATVSPRQLLPSRLPQLPRRRLPVSPSPQARATVAPRQKSPTPLLQLPRRRIPVSPSPPARATVGPRQMSPTPLPRLPRRRIPVSLSPQARATVGPLRGGTGTVATRAAMAYPREIPGAASAPEIAETVKATGARYLATAPGSGAWGSLKGRPGATSPGGIATAAEGAFAPQIIVNPQAGEVTFM